MLGKRQIIGPAYRAIDKPSYAQSSLTLENWLTPWESDLFFVFRLIHVIGLIFMERNTAQPMEDTLQWAVIYRTWELSTRQYICQGKCLMKSICLPLCNCFWGLPQILSHWEICHKSLINSIPPELPDFPDSRVTVWSIRRGFRMYTGKIEGVQNFSSSLCLHFFWIHIQK